MPRRIRSSGRPRRKTFIKAWRKHRGYTQEQLAEVIGSTAATISRVENGIIAYTQDMIEAMAEALNCDPHDLLARDPKDEATAIADEMRDLSPEDRARIAAIVRTFKNQP